MYKTGAAITEKRLANAGFFLFLNILDYLTTHSLITSGGVEVMPLGAAVIRDYGLTGLFIYKVTLPIVLFFFTIRFRFSQTFWDLLNGAFVGIVTWNSLGIFLSIFFD